jgi:hypothetical protein
MTNDIILNLQKNQDIIPNKQLESKKTLEED